MQKVGLHLRQGNLLGGIRDQIELHHASGWIPDHVLRTTGVDPGVTPISFDLVEEERVSLTVYDVKGRAVRILADRTLAPGLHTMPWDGNDESGRRLEAGIYFYSLQTPSFRATRKMVLMR
jgi:flagellar hook assembly protein FlgD